MKQQCHAESLSCDHGYCIASFWWLRWIPWESCTVGQNAPDQRQPWPAWTCDTAFDYWSNQTTYKIHKAHISVWLKPGFGIGNWNQDQVSVSVYGPELFLPKPKLSPILKIYQKIISVMTWKMIQIFKILKEMWKLTSLSCYKWSLEIIFNCFITDWHDTF